MGMLWALPPVILIVGVLLAAVAAQKANGLSASLRDELTRLGEIQVAVAQVRAESATAHRRVDDLRSR